MKMKDLESIFRSSVKSADKLQGFVPDMHIERAEKAYEAQLQRREKHGYKTPYSREFDERGIVVIPNFMSEKMCDGEYAASAGDFLFLREAMKFCSNVSIV